MFLSSGDCLFDLFAQPEADIATVALAGRVGGSPLNVALGLARLGHKVGFLSKMSDDFFGRRIRGFMRREAIDERFLIATERRTTLAMVSLNDEGSAVYDFHIDGTADRSLEEADIPAELPADLEAIHIGSYATVLEPTASALLKLLRQESGRRFVSYDVNVRASVEPDLDLWRERLGEILRHACLVKASEEDLHQLYPGRTLDSVLADWVGAGAELAVVTRGERGAVALAASGGSVDVGGRMITVADTVGAGDTFQAAMLAGLKERGALSRSALHSIPPETVADLLDLAVRAASVTCSRRGADLPRREDLGLPPLV